MIDIIYRRRTVTAMIFDGEGLMEHTSTFTARSQIFHIILQEELQADPTKKRKLKKEFPHGGKNS
jgi:hypothetical protein